MAIKDETFRIDEFTYTIRQFGTTDGARVMVRLLRGAVGPALSGLLGEVASLAPGKRVDLSKLDLAGALKEVTGRLNEEDFEYVTAAIVRNTDVRGKTPEVVPLANVYESHFAGRYGLLLQVVWKGLVLNYRSFFDDLGKARAAATALAAEPAGGTA